MKQTDFESALKNLFHHSDVTPDESFRVNARIRLLNQLELSHGLISHHTVLPTGKIIRWIAAAGSAFVLMGTGVVYAAQSTQPDSPLYPVKIASEQVAVALAPTENIKTSVITDIIDRRASEITHIEQSHEDKNIDTAVERYKKTVREATNSSHIDERKVEEHIAKHEEYIRKVEHRDTNDSSDTNDEQKQKETLAPTSTPIILGTSPQNRKEEHVGESITPTPAITKYPEHSVSPEMFKQESDVKTQETITPNPDPF